MNITLKKILFFLLRFSAAYVFVSVAIFFFGPWVTERHLPAIEAVIRLYGSEHELLSLKTGISGSHLSIIYTFEITKYFHGVSLPLIETLSNSITSSILFVPHIIFYSLILSWAGISWKRRLATIVLSIPVMAAFFISDAAITIISSIELEVRKKLLGYKVDHTFMSSLLVYLCYFFNNGGRQFMGILMTVIAIIPLHMKNVSTQKKKTKRIPGRNDPCTCGSGKKYKNCCGK